MLIHVEHGKGGRDRHAMLSPHLLDVLRAYWRRARPALWLFPGREPGTPVSIGALQAACRAARRRARIGKPVTVHTLRHSFATHLRHAEPLRPSLAHGGPARVDRGVRPVLEVADIFRRHGEDFRAAQGERLTGAQRRVMAAIESCRTAVLGGHVEQCEHCRELRVAYNSCRNRHCPKCQGLARLQWLADRRAEFLPVPYFHLVFTLPAPVAAIALTNKAVVYDILFKAAADTVRTIGADPKHLGGETGMIASCTPGARRSPITRTSTASSRGAALGRTEASSAAAVAASSCRSAFSRASTAACSSIVFRPPSRPAA
jgi:Transposase zinc-binding domain/Phage integrase family